MPSMVFQTWQFIVVALAGWLNRQQQDVGAYLTEENRVLREQLKGKWIPTTSGYGARQGEGEAWRKGAYIPLAVVQNVGLLLLLDLRLL